MTTRKSYVKFVDDPRGVEVQTLRGGWEESETVIDHGDGSESHIGGWMSEGGRQAVLQMRRIAQHYQPILDAWMAHFGSHVCEHGVPFDEFSWSINDYCYEYDMPDQDPGATVFILEDGFHGQDYCMPAWYVVKLGCFYWSPRVDDFIPSVAP